MAKQPDSFETLKEILFETDQVDKVLENAFSGDLNIDNICDHITSNLFRHTVQRIYSFYDFRKMKIPKERLINLDAEFVNLLSRLLRLYFVAYSDGNNKGFLISEFREMDEAIVSFLKRNTNLEIRDKESSFSIIFNKLISRLLVEETDIEFLKGTQINSYNAKIAHLMRELFLTEGFLQKYNSVYQPLLHANMIVFNFSKFLNAAHLLNKGFARFTQKRFENLCSTYKYLSEHYSKHAKLLYALILILKGQRIPDMGKLKGYSLGTISTKLREFEDFQILGMKNPQVRNSIAHEGNHYDATRRRCIFDDKEHGKDPLILSPEEFENETKEMFALASSVSRVASFETIFYFLSMRSLFDNFGRPD